eukprot:Sdes_comp19341_c0_seq1m10560
MYHVGLINRALFPPLVGVHMGETCSSAEIRGVAYRAQSAALVQVPFENILSSHSDSADQPRQIQLEIHSVPIHLTSSEDGTIRVQEEPGTVHRSIFNSNLSSGATNLISHQVGDSLHSFSSSAAPHSTTTTTTTT